MRFLKCWSIARLGAELPAPPIIDQPHQQTRAAEQPEVREDASSARAVVQTSDAGRIAALARSADRICGGYESRWCSPSPGAPHATRIRAANVGSTGGNGPRRHTGADGPDSPNAATRLHSELRLHGEAPVGHPTWFVPHRPQRAVSSTRSTSDRYGGLSRGWWLRRAIVIANHLGKDLTLTLASLRSSAGYYPATDVRICRQIEVVW